MTNTSKIGETGDTAQVKSEKCCKDDVFSLPAGCNLLLTGNQQGPCLGTASVWEVFWISRS